MRCARCSIPLSHSLSAGAKGYARYAICATRIPRGLRAVEAIGISEQGVTLTNHDKTECFVIAADVIVQFLTERQNTE